MAGSDDFNQPYLPERYQKKVRENQSRRLRRKLLIGGAVVVLAIIILLLLSGILSPHDASAPLSPPAPVTTTASPGPAAPAATAPATSTGTPVAGVATAGAYDFVVGPGVPTQASGNLISLDTAVSSLRVYYPADTMVIRSVNFSSGSDRSLFGFTLVPGGAAGEDESVVFLDAATGIPWAPGQDTAAITAAKAKILALSALPGIHPEQVKIWYADDPVRGGEWQFLFLTKNSVTARGTLDATTGDTTALSLAIPHTGRPAVPAIDTGRAKMIADQYISDRNGGPLPLNMTSEQYADWGTPSDPAAGQYLLTYERDFQDFPVDTDGIAVAVDSVTGQVIGYDKTWTTQDYAFSQTLEQAVAKRDATYAVMAAAKTLFPDSVGNVRILSAEIRWNNRQTPGISQRPGSVPLGWKVLFDDAVIRADPSLPLAVGWVDIQTGNVTSLEYRH